MTATTIPSFLLYGEDSHEAPVQIAHIETIASRSALYVWEIAPHRHGLCLQVLLVLGGEVDIRRDEHRKRLQAPCFVVVPVGAVHGFRFAPGTDGYVLSFSADLVARHRSADDPLLDLVTRGREARIEAGTAARARWLCDEMARSMGDRLAPDPMFMALAQALLRSLAPARPAALEPADERLGRFRRLIELHLREHRPVEWYAARLGTTGRTLSRCCRLGLGRSPQQVINARLALEAQRLLLFTSANVAQVSRELGFSDPSYFSRFYLRMTGRRPIAEKAAAP